MRKPIFALLALVRVGSAQAGGDLSRQDPVEILVELGRTGAHGFFPSQIELETGKLDKLVLTNKSDAPHCFTSHDFSQRVSTRKVQVVSAVTDRKALAEFKGPSGRLKSTQDKQRNGGLFQSQPAVSPICTAAFETTTARLTQSTE